MEFNTPYNGVEAYRQGQFHGAIAGIIASTAAYYLFKAYKPNNPFGTKNTNDENS